MTPSLEVDYERALRAYLTTCAEAELSHAYELGRRALHENVGLLRLTEIHHRALADTAGPDVLGTRAAEFLAEAITPFEMATRGYRDTNTALQQANRSLAARNTELERAKESAEAASQELEAFSYSVSHDLRAPLRALMGFSRILLDEHSGQLDDEGKHHLDRIARAATHMSHLIEDMLRLARIARGELESTAVDLTAIAREIADRLASEDPARAVDVVVEDSLRAHGDRGLLTVALENLMRNAWKFTGRKARARIEVGARHDDGAPVFFVRDDGAGFDMRYAAKLFAPFQRLHTTAEFEGTGVGLATVARIVHRHGGKLWAEGAVGAGATFFFTLRDKGMVGDGEEER